MSRHFEVEERGWRETQIGNVLRLKVSCDDGEPMSWEEICETFNASFPGWWAIEVFPPKEEIVNDVNYYHLFAMLEMPFGLNIRY